mmetsp:Transcript_35539/g.69984  ORF Transcript_35539/g.69984 Transcript_35539/m.69984 type:complete len:223 (+) Transcript_35539:1009-1677(+)
MGRRAFPGGAFLRGLPLHARPRVGAGGRRHRREGPRAVRASPRGVVPGGPRRGGDGRRRRRRQPRTSPHGAGTHRPQRSRCARDRDRHGSAGARVPRRSRHAPGGRRRPPGSPCGVRGALRLPQHESAVVSRRGAAHGPVRAGGGVPHRGRQRAPRARRRHDDGGERPAAGARGRPPGVGPRARRARRVRRVRDHSGGLQPDRGGCCRRPDGGGRLRTPRNG